MQNLPCMRWHHGRALQFNGHCLQGMQILRNFSRLLTKLQEACSIGLRKDKFTIEYHPASIESNQFILMGLHHLWQPKLTRHFLSWRNTVQHLINVSFWRSWTSLSSVCWRLYYCTLYKYIDTHTHIYIHIFAIVGWCLIRAFTNPWYDSAKWFPKFFNVFEPKSAETHMFHVWNIEPHLPWRSPKCRQTKST